jgi:ubiquinone/menaquinone biosynthesis C-methylase UbiE
MTNDRHDNLVESQFSAQAAAYVTSAVHAGGDDLRELADLACGRPDARVLDLGCGGGHVSFRLAPLVREVVAYDLSPAMLAVVKAEADRRGLSNIVTCEGPVERLPFETGSFDLVLSRYSAHHWSDFRAGLQEARRVLTPQGHGGFADVVTPGSPLLDTHLQALELLRDASHLRNYTQEEWRQALIAAGFQPGPATLRRLRLEFAAWVERMRTPKLHVEAIRSLQSRMPAEVRRHFALEADGSFTLDTMTIAATPI